MRLGSGLSAGWGLCKLACCLYCWIRVSCRCVCEGGWGWYRRGTDSSRYDGDSSVAVVIQTASTMGIVSPSPQTASKNQQTNKPAHQQINNPQTCIPCKPVSRANLYLHTDAWLHSRLTADLPFSSSRHLAGECTLWLHTILPLVVCTIVLALCYLRTRVPGTCSRIESIRSLHTRLTNRNLH
jgi:hypothetical protein